MQSAISRTVSRRTRNRYHYDTVNEEDIDDSGFVKYAECYIFFVDSEQCLAGLDLVSITLKFVK